jgi:TetR/AcrR family transcriptional regulator
MSDTTQTRTQAERADQTRARILDAATREFSDHGLAGARTERIAEAADVNKALLYYYFRSKAALYAAALEAVAARMILTGMSVLNQDCTAGERILRSTLNHFDRIYSQPVFQTLLQQEMIRLRRGETNEQSPLVETLFKPLGARILKVAEEGIETGELIPVAASQLIYATLGPNVFYFLSAPMMRLLADEDPFDRQVLEFRRKAAIDFLGIAIFVDRNHGAAVAARVLAAIPMPQKIEPPPDPFRDERPGTYNAHARPENASEVRHK